jgi:hypothetical protein
VKTLLVIAGIVAIAFLWPRPADPLPGFPHIFYGLGSVPKTCNSSTRTPPAWRFSPAPVCLHDGAVSVRPRLQPLRYPPGAVLMAVVRVEPQDSDLPPVDAASAAIAEAAAITGVRALQVDFDATLSQRAYYRSLLEYLRRRVPPSMPLSMTALTSWCESDGWVAGLPVVEAVPMLFRMGRGERPARTFRPALCQSSAGVSIDEPLHKPPLAARLYIFNPRPWTESTYRAAIREVPKWH